MAMLLTFREQLPPLGYDSDYDTDHSSGGGAEGAGGPGRNGRNMDASARSSSFWVLRDQLLQCPGALYGPCG